MRPAVMIVLAFLWAVSAPAGTGTVVLRGADLRSAVEAYIGGLPARAGYGYSVECRDVPDSVRVPSGSLRLVVDPGATPVLRGHVALALQVVVNGVVVQRILVAALVRTYADVLLAGRPLAARVAVGPDDVRCARVETTEWSRRPVTDTARLAGRRTKRIIAEGSVLFEELLEPVPFVVHGEPVTLRAVQQGVSISTGAVALEDGVEGSVISVRASWTRERLKARVVARGVVAALEE